MATVHFIKYKKQSAGALSGATRYVSQEEKIRDMDGRQLVSGQNCTPQLADREFQATRDTCRKDSPAWAGTAPRPPSSSTICGNTTSECYPPRKG